MNFQETLDEVAAMSDALIDNATRVAASRLGLDERCLDLYIMPGAIAVPGYADQRLQYYGGFEYVDPQHRHVMGDWVFYDWQDDRVEEHVNIWNDHKLKVHVAGHPLQDTV